jgi:oligoribonuclease NrnB/cAMP/cGMP phosphodiesterase (DHH superfamily)
MITYLYYHNADIDGYLSGYVVKRHLVKKYPDARLTTGRTNLIEEKCKHIICSRPYNYGDKLNVDISDMIESKKKYIKVRAIFVDCCAYGDKENYFDKLYSLLKDDLVIIDHHATAIDFIQNYEREHSVKVTGSLDTGYAACALTAMYIALSDDLSTSSDYEELYERLSYEALPDIIKLASDWDIHKMESQDYNWDEEILPFQYWLRTKILDYKDIITENPYVNDLLDNAVWLENGVPTSYLYNACNEGRSILAYLKTRNQNVLQRYGRRCEVEFCGKGPAEIKKCFCVTDYLNGTQIFSDNGMYNDTSLIYVIIRPDIFKGIYEISLFSTPESNIDVSRIASNMYGGGHTHAAGLIAKDITAINGTDYFIDGTEYRLRFVALPK